MSAVIITKKIFRIGSLLLLPVCACANEYVIPPGEQDNSTVVLSGVGDQLLIEQGGSIAPPTGDGVDMFNANQSVLNNGLIATFANGSTGISSTGINATITNNGTIINSGNDGFGISSTASNAEIMNSGSLFLNGTYDTGINSTGDDAQIINPGNIFVNGEDGIGIYSAGNNVSIINSGNIEMTYGYATAVELAGLNASFTNNGNITIFQFESYGIWATNSGAFIVNNGNLVSYGYDSIYNLLLYMDGPNQQAINTGQITSYGTYGVAIYSDQNNALVRNSGTVAAYGFECRAVGSDAPYFTLINNGTIIGNGTDSAAIYLYAQDPTVTLLKGSNIQGDVYSAYPFAFNVGTGLNLFLNFDPASAGFSSLHIDNPYVVTEDLTVAVVDRTLFAMETDALADLSDGILNNFYRNSRLPSCNRRSPPSPFWVEGFGSWRERHQRPLLDYTNTQGGGLMGYSHPIRKGYIDVFAGGAYEYATIERDNGYDVGNTIGAQNVRVSTGFGGFAYELPCHNHFYGLALVAGYTDFKTRRQVANNLVAGGLETASGNPNGFFLSPEITYSYILNNLSIQPCLTGTVRYAASFLNSYDEHGSAADLQVKNRSIQLLTLKGTAEFCTSKRLAYPYVGIAGRFQVGGNHVNATLLGQSISFDTKIGQNIVYGFIGLNFNRYFCGKNFSFNFEADFDNYNSIRCIGEGCFSYKF